MGGCCRSAAPEKNAGDIKDMGLPSSWKFSAGVLAGSKFGPGMYPATSGMPVSKVSHFFGAIRIEAFTELALFKRLMDEYIGLLKSSSKESDAERIFIHGEKEWELYAKQKEEVAI